MFNDLKHLIAKAPQPSRMAPSQAPSAALLRSLRALAIGSQSQRSLSSTPIQLLEAQTTSQAPPDPATVTTRKEEWELFKAGTPPVGSRRRRAAQAQTSNIPFDKLPYQCFQEARKILVADRAEKLKQIETERARIARLKDVDPATFPGGDVYKQRRLRSMQTELHNLKILADINDPNVKKRFEDGMGMDAQTSMSGIRLTLTGDMNKPIYRFLAERKWREYRRKIQVQRITQLKLVPDVIPNCDPILDVSMAFGRKPIGPGEFVDSNISENPVRLRIQAFEPGEKLLTIAVVDPDIPNFETDSFDSRCHFLATNIPITPTAPQVDLINLSESQVLLPWFPPTAQKGSQYHRLCIAIFQQKDNIPIDNTMARQRVQPDGFSARALMTRHMLKPIAATLFRTQWDDHMADVMTRHGVSGGDIELKRKKVEPLPYKRRNPSSFR